MDIEKLIEQLRKSADFEDYPVVASFAAIIKKKYLRDAADALADLQSENKKLKSDNAYLRSQIMNIWFTEEPERCAILFRIDTWAALRRGAVHDLADIVMAEIHKAIDEQYR